MNEIILCVLFMIIGFCIEYLMFLFASRNWNWRGNIKPTYISKEFFDAIARSSTNKEYINELKEQVEPDYYREVTLMDKVKYVLYTKRDKIIINELRDWILKQLEEAEKSK